MQEDFSYMFTLEFQIPDRILHYFQMIQPFVLIFFVNMVLSYLAGVCDDESEGRALDDDEEEEDAKSFQDS